MNNHKTASLLVAALGMVAATGAQGASSNASLDISLNVASSATLTLGATNLTFNAEDPIVQPVVPAAENPVSVLARVRTKGTPSLTVLAQDDLKSGDDIIPVSAISWSADGSPYTGGTLSKTTDQPAAAFPQGSGNYSSSFRYSLANSTSYVPGTYASTVIYTLTSP
jgi:hypothetical protein